MGYKSDGASMTKLNTPRYLAASLAYLIAFQHDAAGLITFDSDVRERIPAAAGTRPSARC